MTRTALSPARAGRLALLTVPALIALSLLYAAVSLWQDGLNLFAVWGAIAALLTGALLWFQWALLRALFSGRGLGEGDARLRAYRALYPWALGVSGAQLALYLLVFVLSPAPGGAPNPLAALLFAVGWGASLYASYFVYLSLARAALAPGDSGRRAALREWLWRSLIAGAVFYAMNVQAALQTAGGWTWPQLLPNALYIVLALLDLGLTALTRSAIRAR